MLTYDEFRNRSRFSKDELLAMAHGRLISNPPPEMESRLPSPPMLMFDRITEISKEGNRGKIKAEQDIQLDAWFFQCHFLGDPVQPGCLGLDAVWQLLGYFCCWSGGLGAGRALGCGEVEFFGQIRPHDRVVTYDIDVRRYAELPASGSAVVVGDATVLVDDEPIYSIQGAKVGIFKGIDYPDYPWPSEHSRGGKMSDE